MVEIISGETSRHDDMEDQLASDSFPECCTLAQNQYLLKLCMKLHHFFLETM
jgi:hypothetical protein